MITVHDMRMNQQWEPKTTEDNFLIIFRKHMSNNVEDFIYVPQGFLQEFFDKSQHHELARLKKKYKIWVEDIVGVKHWVMNPGIEIKSSVQILSLIRQVCTEYDKIKPMEGERYSRIVNEIDDDDIPF